jgi:hypothetical protein
MIAWASGFGMGVVRFSRRLRRVGVIAMLNVALDTPERVHVSQRAGGL